MCRRPGGRRRFGPGSCSSECGWSCSRLARSGFLGRGDRGFRFGESAGRVVVGPALADVGECGAVIGDGFQLAEVGVIGLRDVVRDGAVAGGQFTKDYEQCEDVIGLWAAMAPPPL